MFHSLYVLLQNNHVCEYNFMTVLLTQVRRIIPFWKLVIQTAKLKYFFIYPIKTVQNYLTTKIA